MAYIKGVDVSRWQGIMNWQICASQDIKFAFIRAVGKSIYGLYEDQQFAANLINAPNHIECIAPYVLVYPATNVNIAFNYMVDIYNKYNYTPKLIALDCELDEGKSQTEIRKWIKDWIALTETRWNGVKIIFYSRTSWWNLYVGWEEWMRPYPIWWARYVGINDNDDPVGLTGPWSDGYYKPKWDIWHVWQYTSSGIGSKYGASSSYIDLNVWNNDLGDMDSLKEMFGVLPPPPDPDPPPPDPDPPPPDPDPPPIELPPPYYYEGDLPEVSIMDGLIYVPLNEKILFHHNIALTGSVSSGQEIILSGLPSNVKTLDVRIICTSDKEDSLVFFGDGNSGDKRYRIGVRTKIADLLNIWEENNGNLPVSSSGKIYRQHDARDGTVIYSLVINGYYISINDYFASLSEQINSINDELGIVSSDVGQLKYITTDHETRIILIESTLSTISLNIKDIQDHVDDLYIKFNLQSAEIRVIIDEIDEIKKKIYIINDAIDIISNNVDLIKIDVDNIKTTISYIVNQIENLIDDISILNKRVDKNEVDIDVIRYSLNDMIDKLADLESKIEDIEIGECCIARWLRKLLEWFEHKEN